MWKVCVGARVVDSGIGWTHGVGCWSGLGLNDGIVFPFFLSFVLVAFTSR